MKQISTLVLTAMLLLCGTSAMAQNEYHVIADLTNSKLQNADFQSGSAVETTVYTYTYNMASGMGVGDGGSERFGQQEVPGWTPETPSDNKYMTEDQVKADEAALTGAGVGMNARAAAVFQHSSEIGLGGAYYAPETEDENAKMLGYVAVWSGDIKYYQNVTLPAGVYMIRTTYYNVSGTTAVNKNYLGFLADDGTEYLSSRTQFPISQDGVSGNYVAVVDTILFQLEAETSGKIQVGYRAANAGSGAMPHIFVEKIELLQIDPNDLIRDKINERKVDLLALIDEGKKYGADTTEAQAVYDNPTATMDEVEAAITKQKQLNEDATTDLSAAFITNPHFTMDDAITGGICTYDYDMAGNSVKFFGSQPLTGWVTFRVSDNTLGASNRIENGRASGIYNVGDNAFLGGNGYNPPAKMSDGSTTGKVLGMVTCWSQTIQYTQHTTLPVGKYILSISYYNSGGTTAINKNLIGFIADNGTEYLSTKTTFPVGQWTKDIIEFELTEQTAGNFTMGYISAGVGSASMPHFFIDGISLIYIGTGIDPDYLALKAAVENAEDVLDNSSFYTGLESQLSTATTTGRDLLDNHSGTAETYKAAANAINELMPAVQANIKAYESLANFAYEGDGALNIAIVKYQNENVYPNVINFLGNLSDNVNDALSYYNLDTDQIEALMSSLNEQLKVNLQLDWDAAVESGAVLPEPMDISPLFDTLGATYSASALTAGNVVDKQWKYGSATNFKTQYGTMEVWNQTPFEVSQTMTEMPGGTYTIGTRGFYRNGSNEETIANYDPNEELAFVFAGSSRKALVNDAAFASVEAVSGWYDASGVYVPNSQLNAHDLFEDMHYDEYTYREVKTVLPAGSDLTFGVQADEMLPNSWVVWYTFSIYFNNTSASDLPGELEQLLEENLRLQEQGAERIDDLYTDLIDAYDQGSDALDGGSDDEIEKAVTKLRTANDSAKEAIQLLAEFAQEGNFYDSLIQKYPDIISSATSIYDAIDSALDEESTFDSVAELRNLKDGLMSNWYRYVLGQPSVRTASETQPADLTGLIINPDFELLDTSYWTISDSIGTNVGYQSNATYKNADNEVVIEHFMEAWRSNNEPLKNGTMTQTIQTYLPEGYYFLYADAFAVNQTADFADDLVGINLFAGDDASIAKSSITQKGDNSTVAKHISCLFYSDGTTYTTVGVVIENTNANWYVIDNFKLHYVGTNKPETGIDEVAENAAEGAAPRAVFNLTGARVKTLQKGINIVVDANGNARKVLVK